MKVWASSRVGLSPAASVASSTCSVQGPEAVAVAAVGERPADGDLLARDGRGRRSDVAGGQVGVGGQRRRHRQRGRVVGLAGARELYSKIWLSASVVTVKVRLPTPG